MPVKPLRFLKKQIEDLRIYVNEFLDESFEVDAPAQIRYAGRALQTLGEIIAATEELGLDVQVQVPRYIGDIPRAINEVYSELETIENSYESESSGEDDLSSASEVESASSESSGV